MCGVIVVETPEGRRRYLERMSLLLTNVFNVEPLTNRVEEMAARLRPLLARDPAALLNFEQGVDRLVTRIAQRAQSVARQLNEVNHPFPFDATCEARLSGWRSQRDSGSPSFSHNPGRPNAPGLFEIRAAGAPAYGSWGTTGLLGAGEYLFVGKGRTRGLEIGPGVESWGVRWAV